MTSTESPFDLNGFFANTRWPGVLDTAMGMPVFYGEAEHTDPVVQPDALQGDPGDRGEPAPPIGLQTSPADDTITTYERLPRNLSAADAGKTWWIGNRLYRWNGSRYVMRVIGGPGPRGPMPVLSFDTITQRPWDSDTTIDVTGSPTAPHIGLNLAVPRGAPGPSGPIAGALDFTGTPQSGDVPTWNAATNRWEPSARAIRHPRTYSVPEAAFQRIELLEFGEVTILEYDIEAQDYDWIPWITGHLKATGLVLSTEPFRADGVVRLRTTNGPAVAHGAGNITEWAHIVPAFFTGSSPAAGAAAPSSIADPASLAPYVVHQGEPVTIYIRLGQLARTPGKMFFDPDGAQITILTVSL